MIYEDNEIEDNEILETRCSDHSEIETDAHVLSAFGSTDLTESPTPIWARPTLSSLMATYARERPDRLARALESIFKQTVAPDEVVLVVDGPIPPEQEQVIARYAQDKRIAHMVVVRLSENQGLGAALNAGLERCQGEWIMRMDSDDESLEDRVAVQLDYLQRNPGIDVLGSWSQEFFEESPVTRLRSSPVNHDAIVQALRFRNIMVHPSLMIRAEALRAVGGYRANFPLLEDWDLYARMILAQGRFSVVPKVLVRMLVGMDMAKRRGGFRYLYQEARFRTFLWTSGFVNTFQYVFSLIAYAVFRLLGPAIRNQLYHVVRTAE
jgi:glycosyltransferase involved in cell wall biosynthesis